jgi:hypothetical protein
MPVDSLTNPDPLLPIAKAIAELINSKPRSPTVEEIRAVLCDGYAAAVTERECGCNTTVQRHYRQRVVSSPGSSVTAQDLYDDYCDWCELKGKEALPMPTYSREFKTLGVRKVKIGGRIRYFHVELRAVLERAEDIRTRA